MLKRPGGEKMAMNDVECCEENCIHAELLKKAREKMPDEDELYKLPDGTVPRTKVWFYA